MLKMSSYIIGEISTSILLGLIAAGCFYPSISGQFVFDDAEAILNNNDIHSNTPIEKLFKHDFWGTPLIHNYSHKSYRPLTVLSFRFHVWWNNGNLDPYGFHLFNLILHGIATALTYPVLGKLFGLDILGWNSKAFLASLLFAVHPIHSEAVAGIVGRADLLCAIFFLSSFLVYAKATASLSIITNILYSLISTILAGVALLCKEQGITVIGICSAYDIFVVNNKQPLDIMPLPYFIKLYVFSDRRKLLPFHKPRLSILSFVKKNQKLIVRHIILLVFGTTFSVMRCWIMNFTHPGFRLVDNPHSFAETFIERVLNYNYIYALNAWLLICPEWLCFDWSMGCVPIIRLDNFFNDKRILAIFVFWLVFGLLLWISVKRSHSSIQRDLLMGIVHIIVPFSVASNLFVTVGFVIAERILYLPSIGYCMLIVIGVENLLSQMELKKVINGMLIFLVFINTLRCHQRSLDWVTEKQLFQKGLSVCPLNAKVHYNYAKTAENTTVAIKHYHLAIKLYPEYEQAMNNLANVLRDDGRISEAEYLLRKAISLRPDFAAAWMNLGIVLSAMNRFDEALECYHNALSYRRKYPDCYYNLGNLFLAQERYSEAYAAWRQATALKPTHTIAWNNMIVMLDSIGELEKAQSLATEALMVLPDDSSLHFNLANTLGKKGLYEKAEQHFLKAIELKQDQALYHTNLGVLYHRWKKYKYAEREYMKALSLNPEMKNAEQNLKTVQKYLSIGDYEL